MESARRIPFVQQMSSTECWGALPFVNCDKQHILQIHSFEEETSAGSVIPSTVSFAYSQDLMVSSIIRIYFLGDF